MKLHTPLSLSLAFSFVLMLATGITARAQPTTVTYNSGSGTFDVPQGVTEITVEVWGAGGRGGTRSSNGSGGGGGGGAYSKSILQVSFGQQFNYSVGIGSSSTSPGGDTWFGSTTTVMAKGGASVGDNSNTSGAGGAALSGHGDLKYSGGNGAIGPNNYGGGGASSASSESNGNYTNTTTTTQNAAAIEGGGNGGRGSYNVIIIGYNGDDGIAPGGGGGGGSRTTVLGAGILRTPGNGANGRVIITYTEPSCQNGTLTLTSDSGTDAQTVCVGTAITNITYAVGGDATGAGATGLPTGVTGSFSGGIFTISGTPSEDGTFNYTVTTTGTPSPCDEASENGTITVNELPEFTYTPSHVTCFGGDNGSITITVSGGTMPYQYRYSIDDGANWIVGWTTFTDDDDDDVEVIVGLEAGDYLIQVRDNNQCTQTECAGPLP